MLVLTCSFNPTVRPVRISTFVADFSPVPGTDRVCMADVGRVFVAPFVTANVVHASSVGVFAVSFGAVYVSVRIRDSVLLLSVFVYQAYAATVLMRQKKYICDNYKEEKEPMAPSVF